MIIFLDIETTDRDPATSHVLEIAAIVVDDDLNDVDSFHAVLPYVRTGAEDPIVLKMHEANGLWVECEHAHHEEAPEWFIANPECIDGWGIGSSASLASFFDQYPGAQLAGRAVSSLDRPFLEHHFPGCTAALSHRVFDLRTCWALGDLVPGLWDGLGASAPGASHRAMDDVRGDLDALRAMRAKLRLLQERWAV